MSSPSSAVSSSSSASTSSNIIGNNANSSSTKETGLPLMRPRIVIPSRAMALAHSEGRRQKESTAPVVTPKDPYASSASTVSSSSRIAAPGKEKIGRWTEVEHKVFLQGLEKHGKQWKVIAGMIGTRTVVQVRTHAQKYFQRVDKQHSPPAIGNNVDKPSSQQAKRKMSLPASLPSRKKSKSGAVDKKSVPRAASLSLVPGVVSPVPGMPSTGSSHATDLSHYPSYVSNSSSSDMSNWSATISPSSIIDEQVIEQLNLDDGYYCGPGENQVQKETTEDDVQEYDLRELGPDPLEWLIEAEPSFLPESSLPVFPELSSAAAAAPGECTTTFLQPANTTTMPGLVESSTSEEEDDSTGTENLACALDSIADPTVTVQSLFWLPDDDNV